MFKQSWAGPLVLVTLGVVFTDSISVEAEAFSHLRFSNVSVVR